MKSKAKNKLVAFAKESVPSLATRSSFVGAEEAGMKGWRGRAADISTKHGKIAEKMKSASRPLGFSKE